MDWTVVSQCFKRWYLIKYQKRPWWKWGQLWIRCYVTVMIYMIELWCTKLGMLFLELIRRKFSDRSISSLILFSPLYLFFHLLIKVSSLQLLDKIHWPKMVRFTSFCVFLRVRHMIFFPTSGAVLLRDREMLSLSLSNLVQFSFYAYNQVFLA